MDRTLDREESKELMALLGLSMSCWGNIPMMRRAYKVQCRNLHPDKGGDEEKMKRLTELYKKLEETLGVIHSQNESEEGSWNASEVPRYATPEWEQWWKVFNENWEDLYCNEKMDESDEERPGPSQTTPPKKKAKMEDPIDDKFPECLNEYVSQALFSNRTLNCFLIHTTKEKSINLYKKLLQGKWNPNFVSRHGYKNVGFIFMLTPQKHRVSAVNNYCKSFCTVSFVNCKGVNQIYPLYSRLCRDPFTMCEESIAGGLEENDFTAEDISGGEKKDVVNWKQITDYALEIKCDDVYLLMGMYLDFQYEPTLCTKCQQKIIYNHYKFHEKEYNNAKIFAEAKAQKNICQQAVDAVLAKRRVDNLTLTRQQLLNERILSIFDKMDLILKEDEILRMYMGGVAWYLCLKSDMDEIVYKYMNMIVTNIPKRRYWLFKGPVNSGKTTVAAALLDLCGGKALNINLPFDRINFELGCAIDQFTVVFEDVKGQVGENKNLPSGNGVSNLDNLRDYMDGSVAVNLEKKHVNKRSQIFPPGLVTMNEYTVPFTLQARFEKVFTFQPKKHLKDSLKNTPEMLQYRVLQSGVTLLLLLIWCKPVSAFVKEIQHKVVYWKEMLEKIIGFDDYCSMKHNIQRGHYIFEEEPTHDILPDDDSMNMTQNEDLF
ncbi:large T [Betapolyomavirus vicugnae]|uniref:Large T antigen n=1 Tax=Alpaca polyomavirus TaxID=1970065 RepID=A0A1V0CLV9_9POLY|nr:large T [Betapolyomavirus vicugnae]ARA71321.1 large T [Betapolyomavirus vicugnae]